MSNDSEVRLTEQQWLKRQAQEQCMTYGHSWDVLDLDNDGLPDAIHCPSCGWMGTLTMGPVPTLDEATA